MAGVNNPPNLKPLIDAQSAEQALDFSWLKSIAAGNKLKLEKANTDLAKANADLAAVFESVNSSSAATQTAVAQSAIDSESATNAARDLVAGQVTQLAAEVDALKAEMQTVKTFADFDVNAVSNIDYRIIQIPHADLNGLAYSRQGKGILKAVAGSHRNDVKIYADGKLVIDFAGVTSSDTRRSFITSGGAEYIKYFESIEVYATPVSSSGQTFTISDKVV